MMHCFRSFCIAIFCSVAATAVASTITVQDIGDGAGNAANCPGAGCRLRDALAKVVDSDTINFSVTGAITLNSGELLVDKSVTISGPGANNLAVDANHASRVFHIEPGKTVTISGLTIRNGHDGIVGGGIYNDHATLTLADSVLSGNSADSDGGGIYNAGQNSGSATLTLSNSTITGNSAANVGGGIDNNGSANGSAQLIVTNCTLSGNSASQGGAILNFGDIGSATLMLINSTLSDNSAGVAGGIFNLVATTTIGNTILNRGAAGENIYNSGTVSSLGYNLSSDAAGGDGSTGSGGLLNGTGDIRNTDPKLGPLANYGGPTMTHALLFGSPAIDQGKDLSGTGRDQRDRIRPNDEGSIANAAGGDGSDMGAFELYTIKVTNNSDDSGSTESLRKALLDALEGDAIYFDPSLTGQAITLTNGQLVVDKSVDIAGLGANNLAVDGNHAGRVFYIAPGKTATISGLRIRNGLASGSFPNTEGGGIYNDHATLTLINSIVSDNSATDDGGGIMSNGTSSSAALTLANTTLSGNSARFAGAIYNAGESSGRASLTLTNSTLSGNSATVYGGGIYNDSFLGGDAIVILINCTFSGNAASRGGGIFNAAFNGSATLTIGNTILKAGDSGQNIYNTQGTIVSNGYNLSSDAGVTNESGGSGSLNATGDQINTAPMLDPDGLQDNGGPTLTIALQPGSPAIDKGKNLSSFTTDQRGAGFARTFDKLIANAPGGDGTDIGALEVQNVAPAISGATISRSQGGPSSHSQIATVNDDVDQPTALSVTVNGASSATVNGVGVSNIAVDSSGNVTADAVASCSASNASFTLRVTDTSGLYAEATLTVSVAPNQAPVITVPKTITVTARAKKAKGHKGAFVSFHVSAVDPEDGTVPATADPPSGSFFRYGTHTVKVTATDQCGNSAHKTFTVIVRKRGG